MNVQETQGHEVFMTAFEAAKFARSTGDIDTGTKENLFDLMEAFGATECLGKYQDLQKYCFTVTEYASCYEDMEDQGTDVGYAINTIISLCPDDNALELIVESVTLAAKSTAITFRDNIEEHYRIGRLMAVTMADSALLGNDRVNKIFDELAPILKQDAEVA